MIAMMITIIMNLLYVTVGSIRQKISEKKQYMYELSNVFLKFSTHSWFKADLAGYRYSYVYETG